MKKGVLLFSLVSLMFVLSSCTLFRSHLDNITNFSVYLHATEVNIRDADWSAAKQNLAKSMNAWRVMKPYLQIDIDHDYVNDIEADFIKLKANLETRQKPNSLEYILLIQHNWKNAGAM
ncbi:MAG TPA: DUF4363 family protein [Bacillota bacterium]|nr:DUF4363 family protein [Bacillota bacterium]HOL10364.1 DUF4363 family protein [Bacillota bacterium]HPO98115.1 DUF4363 family protein [Bacillota bacterium]